MKNTCPFCGGESFAFNDMLSICWNCFKRWETSYTEKLRSKFKGGLSDGTETKEEEG
jgi:hypothetical protein